MLLTLGALSWPQPGRATEEYAERSQQACAYCHRDPAGGGALTGAGEAFAAAGRQWPIPPEAGSGRLSPAARVFRFVLGFAHLLAAVLWLGTIFYVHLVLKPHYAKGGLPKTEMRIAWGSIAVLALTGVPLTALRFRDPGALLATTAGNLLLVKVGLYLFLVLAAAFVTLVLSPRLKARRAAWQDNDGVEGRRQPLRTPPGRGGPHRRPQRGAARPRTAGGVSVVFAGGRQPAAGVRGGPGALRDGVREPVRGGGGALRPGPVAVGLTGRAGTGRWGNPPVRPGSRSQRQRGAGRPRCPPAPSGSRVSW